MVDFKKQLKHSLLNPKITSPLNKINLKNGPLTFQINLILLNGLKIYLFVKD